MTAAFWRATSGHCGTWTNTGPGMHGLPIFSCLENCLKFVDFWGLVQLIRRLLEAGKIQKQVSFLIHVNGTTNIWNKILFSFSFYRRTELHDDYAFLDEDEELEDEDVFVERPQNSIGGGGGGLGGKKGKNLNLNNYGNYGGGQMRDRWARRVNDLRDRAG